MTPTLRASAPIWPEIPYEPWAETCMALHLWTQIIGKYRLSLTPWVNHSWHATLYVTPRGLSTGPVPDAPGAMLVDLDVQDQVCVVSAENGAQERFDLAPMSVAQFYGQFGAAIEALGGRFAIHPRPNEIADPIAFPMDTAPRPYDADAVVRFHQALVRISDVFSTFRTGFIGKVSPVHLFWGSFDLAVTRFSGRPAPVHPGGVPNLPDTVTREAYSHEVSSAGFWPGLGVGEPMFYAYAYPTPANFAAQPIQPAAAGWNEPLGEFLLPYEAVRTASDPKATLLAFLQSTYEAAANTATWDREALECGLGAPGVPRDLNPR
ncbi:MAG: DUF5996 family protein [Maricaulaceae bacterium]